MRRIHPNLGLRLLAMATLLPWSLSAQNPVRPVDSAQAAAARNRVYSPTVDAGDYFYISGCGPGRSNGSVPSTFPEQARQALDNVKLAVESAGLSIDHLVYTQVYLEDISKYDELNQVFAEYFGNTAPARAVLGVARVPESPIEISAVAVRSLVEKKPVYPANYKSRDPAPPGMLTQDRLFISSMPGIRRHR